MRKPWWESKTVWFGMLEIAAGTLVLLVDSELFTADAAAGLLTAAGVLTLILRFLTSRPIMPPRPCGAASPSGRRAESDGGRDASA